MAVKTYHYYLRGRQFFVHTDHGALKWLLKFKNPEGQLARSLELLGIYDLTSGTVLVYAMEKLTLF